MALTVVADLSAVTISPAPEIIVCQNAILTLSVTATTGGSGNWVYDWERSTTGVGSWVNAPGTQNAATYTVPTGALGTFYYRQLLDDSGAGCGDNVASNVVKVTVVTQPTAPVIARVPDFDEVCAGDILSITVTTPGSGAGCEDQFRYSTDGGATWSNWEDTIPLFGAIPGTNLVQSRRFCSDGCEAEGNEVSWEVNSSDGVILTASASASAIECGETVDVTVDVSGFCGLVSLDFALGWDPDQFEYVSHTATAVDGENPIIGTGQTGDGVLSFNWSDGNLYCGGSTADGTTLLTVTFTAHGCDLTDAAVVFLNPPDALLEAYDCNFAEVPVSVNNNALVDIDDATPPAMSCPPGLTAVCDLDEQPVYEDFDAFYAAGGTASDGCGLDTLSFKVIDQQSVGSCPEVLTRTYEISDICGNATTCTQTVTRNDETDPEIAVCPPAEAYEGCNTDAVTSFIYSETAVEVTVDDFLAAGGEASDNCGIAKYEYQDIQSGSCPITVTRTWTVTDECGNSTSCPQTITIDDVAFPTITCPDALIAACTIPTLYAALAEFTDAGGSTEDNCGIDAMSFLHAGDETDEQSCPETIIRTYQIADLCGNTAVCTQTITLNDEEPPVLTCPADLTATCDAGAPDPYNSYVDFTIAGGSFSDNCGVNADSFTFVEDNSDNNDCPEVITRTYSIEDQCGNVGTCAQIITIYDLAPPTLLCPPGLTAECSASEQPVYTNFDAFETEGGSATDNCSGVDEGSFEFLGEGTDEMTCPETITRTYQIADQCGNMTTCIQTILVDDNTPPTMVCPPPPAPECGIGDAPAYADLAAFLTAGGTVEDHCPIDELSFALTTEEPGLTTCPLVVVRIYTAADQCGNAAFCTQTIVVDDLTPPTMTCPPGLTASCDASEQPVYTNFNEFESAGGSATDNCAVDEGSFLFVNESSDGGTCPEIVTRIYRVEDECENPVTCTQTVTILDLIPPALTCPPNLTATCDAAEQAPYTSFDEFTDAGGGAEDNCAIEPASFSLLSETSDNETCPEIVTRTYQIEDLCGNAGTCAQTVTVDDAVPPSMTCPDNLTASCSIDEQPAYVNYDAFELAGGTSSDNCSIDEGSFLLLDEDSDGGSCPETVTRIYQVADLCGNVTTCVQLVTVHDLVLPELQCPPALTAVCSISEQAPYADFAAFTDAGGSADDNCGIVPATFSLFEETSDNNTCPEVVTRVYTIADLCGNSTFCVQTITIDDEINPEITCPANLTAVCAADEQAPYTSLAEFENAGGNASDNCDIDDESFTLLSATSDGQSCPEVETRIYQIADLCGNLAVCTQTVTVNAAENPHIK